MNTRIDVLDSQYSSRKSVIDNAIRPKKIANVNQIPPDRLNEMIADHLLRQDNVKRGLQYYNQALAMNPQDPKLLQKRSDANRKYFRMEAGMADVQRSLKINPDDLSGINRLLKFLYLNGEFEKSLLLNMKYSKIRKQPPHFTDGVLECTRAIKVCVGKNAGHPLRDHFEIIRELAWKKNMSMQKGHPKRRKKRKKKKPTVATSTAHVFESVKPPKILRPYEPPGLDDEDSEDEQDIATDSIKPIVCMKKIAGFSNKVTKIHDVPMFRSSSRMSLRKRVSTTESRAESYQSLATVSLDSSLGGSLEYSEPPIHIPKVYMYMYHPLQRRTANIENYMSSMYLGELLQEKKFFTTLLERPGCSGYNVNANERIDDASKDGLHILYTAQEILRTRKPFYYIKYQELMTKSKKVEMDNIILMEKKKNGVIKKLNHYFTNIAKQVKRMDVRHMMKLAENMYRYCKNTDIAILPDKESVLCRLYKLIGDGLLFSNKFSPGMTPQRMLTRVHLALGLPIVRTISQESLYRKLTARGQNWIDSITVYEQRVRDCQYSEELIWLYYSLANFNIEVRRYSLAKNYAGKCIHEARKCENFRWAINGYLLLTKISVHQKNKNEVRRQLRLAISTAKNIENEELDYFLQTCLTVINECTLERDKPDQLLKQRQQEIVQLITPYEKKREAWLLFDNIRQRPPDRRLPIIPGLVDTDEYDRIERLKEERRQAKRKHKSKPARQRGMEAEELISAYLTSSTEVYL